MNNNFENERGKLLVHYTYLKDTTLSNKMKLRFLKLIELVVFNMLKTKPFFGEITVQFGRELQFEKNTPLSIEIKLDEFNLVFNPLLFLQYSFEEMENAIIHEILHLFFKHPEMQHKLSHSYSNSAISKALDDDLKNKENRNSCLDNYDDVKENAKKYQSNLDRSNSSNSSGQDQSNSNSKAGMSKEFQKSLNSLKDSLGNDEEFQSLPEEIKAKITQQLKKDFQPKVEDLEDSHYGWKASGDYNDRVVSGNFYKIVDSALEKNRGLMPAYLEGYFERLNLGKSPLKWQQILRSELGKLPVPYRKTITRKNRRQPDRMDLKGILPRYICKIFVAIDTSGSMGEKELNYAFREIFNILKHYDYELTVIECDADIERVYKVKRKRDVKFQVKGRGGTAFTPVFRYLEEKKEKDYILLYFTDGYGEESVPKPKGRLMWIITGDEESALSVKVPHGKVKGLQYSDKDN